jgi:hypothetical protein
MIISIGTLGEKDSIEDGSFVVPAYCNKILVHFGTKISFKIHDFLDSESGVIITSTSHSQ